MSEQPHLSDADGEPGPSMETNPLVTPDTKLTTKVVPIGEANATLDATIDAGEKLLRENASCQSVREEV